MILRPLADGDEAELLSIHLAGHSEGTW